MVLYYIIIGLAVYYLALWGWYRRVAVNNRTASQPERKKWENTASLVGESRFRSGLMRTNGDILGHFPQAVENDTTFAPDAGGEDEETDFEMTFEAAEEPDYEDEEIADETGQATGVEFEKLVEAVRTVNTPKPAEADKQQAAETLGQITGTNLYDAVVANINGELEKVAELLKRNEAAVIPTTETPTAGTNEEYRKFDMNEFL
ncbi:hypothetical protein K0F43_08695 [Bacteroides fragilis]|nr:hypothetical protein [Bacteroides fragilis]MCE8764780.1 hypothetical protein [Bacteroides fragilis]